MKKHLNIKAHLKLVVLFLALFGLGITACEEEEWSENYDIDWPLPVINSFAPETAEIGTEVTVTGSGFTKLSKVSVGNVSIQKENFELISDNEIKFTVPRVVSMGKIHVRTAYARETASENSFVPQFPATTVSGLPAVITRTRSFAIMGENVDLITKIKVGDSTMTIDGSEMSPDEITISTAGINLSAETVTVTVLEGKGELKGTLSAEIPVEDPSILPPAMAPLVLFDFEDGVNPFQSAGGSLNPVASIDGPGVAKGRGEHYFSLKAENVSGWTDLGHIEISEAVDLSDFTHPHLTFLVNTNGNAGYFQLEDGQGGWYHFLQSPDNYMFETDGWEWRSYDLKQVDDGKDLDLNNFLTKLMFKTGNVSSGTFEIHLDQVMITNGKVNPAIKLYDFEDQGSNPFENTGGANAGFNLSSGVAPLMGDGYYTVQKSGVGSWSDLGPFQYGETLDVSDMAAPYLSFWVNTKGDGGYIQLEDGQGSWGHFAANEYGDDYKFVTDGWELRSVNLNEFPWEGEGFDPANFTPKLMVKTGNVAGEFELNIDEVYISDGPMY